MIEMIDDTKTVLSEYILVTPVKDEEQNLPFCINSIMEQTVRPFLWVIVDDGSTDETPEILHDLKTNYEWVKIITLKESDRSLGLHLAFVYNMGLNFATEYCNKNGMKYEFLSVLDADTVLDINYFRKLFHEFKADASLGIASGIT